MRGGLSQVNILATTIMKRHFRFVGGRYVGDRFGDDSPDGCQRLSASVRNQRHHRRIAAGHHRPPSHNSVIYSLATGGVVSITSLFLAGVVQGCCLASR